MAARNSARSRAMTSGPSLQSYSGADGQLDELGVFEADDFDAEEFCRAKCQSMSEKGIRKFVNDLLELKRVSADEMRKNVYHNYPDFIQTSRRISDLEGKLLQMRNLLSQEAATIHGLLEGGPTLLPQKSITEGQAEEALEEELGQDEERDLSEHQVRAQALPDLLDVLLAERKVADALNVLEEGEKLAAGGQVEGGSGRGVLSGKDAAELHAALTERRARLAEQLAEAAQQPSVRGAELRDAVAALVRLGDGPRAHTLLLSAHQERLKMAVRSLRPTGTSYGGAYTAALSQLVFSTIAAAASDSLAVFGEQPAYASELVMWAHTETERCAGLLQRHVLSSSAAAGGLRAAVECVQIALGHCVLLEEHGLALCPALSRLLKPSVELALDANLRRIEESVQTLAASEDWLLTVAAQGTGRRAGAGPPGTGAGGLRLTSSAHRLYNMIQEFVDDVVPVVSMQLTGVTIAGLAHAFECYVALLQKALPQVEQEEGAVDDGDTGLVRPAVNDAQQLALLANASALADELLPRVCQQLTRVPQPAPSVATSPATPTPPRPRTSHARQASGSVRPGGGQGTSVEQQYFRRRSQKAVEKLRDAYCTQLVLQLLYEAEERLFAEDYLRLDTEEGVQEQEGRPSKTFLSFFDVLTSVASTASALMVGRERTVTQLMMKLADILASTLTGDVDFWAEVDQQGLGPNALKQFLLDMTFFLQVATAGRYASRLMRQVVSDTIERAKQIFEEHGGDASRVVSDDGWFLARAQEAVRELIAQYTTQASPGMKPSPRLTDEPPSPTFSESSSIDSRQ